MLPRLFRGVAAGRLFRLLLLPGVIDRLFRLVLMFCRLFRGVAGRLFRLELLPGVIGRLFRLGLVLRGRLFRPGFVVVGRLVRFGLGWADWVTGALWTCGVGLAGADLAGAALVFTAAFVSLSSKPYSATVEAQSKSTAEARIQLRSAGRRVHESAMSSSPYLEHTEWERSNVSRRADCKGEVQAPARVFFQLLQTRIGNRQSRPQGRGHPLDCHTEGNRGRAVRRRPL